MNWHSNNKIDITVAAALEAFRTAGSLRGAAKLLNCHKDLIARRLKESDVTPQRAIDAVAAHGSKVAAARMLEVPVRVVEEQYIAALEQGLKADVQALAGWSAGNADKVTAPPSNAIPEGQQISGISTRVDKFGETDQQWIKTKQDSGEVYEVPEGLIVQGESVMLDASGRVRVKWVKSKSELEDQLEATVRAIREAFADAPRVEPIPAPTICESKLLTVYPIGDHHVGMRSWGEETGSDYDIKIAEDLLTSAAAHLVDVSPASETALLVNLGDFFHVDNLKNQTSRSGNTLDVDTRYPAMIRAGIKMLRAVIESMLRKHKFVVVFCVIGNHDDIGAIWLQQALSLFYDMNPRVRIEMKPGKFHYYQHGKCLIGTTHGDTGKPEKLQGVMAADMPVAWGETEFRYWLTGHIHQRKVLEFPGVMWETFRTLPPNDAWATAAAYRSGRDMTSIVMHEQYGEVERHRFDVAMLEAA